MVNIPFENTRGVRDVVFFPLFWRHTSNAYANDAARSPRGRTLTRGILIGEKDLKMGNWDEGYFFQFNPQSISDSKETAYEVRPYAGLPYNDYNWSNGGERIISFQLFLDDTPQTHTKEFRPQIEADTIVEGKKAIDSFVWSSSGAYSRTRIHKRGILDDVEKIQSFLYPEKLKGEHTPKFAEGGVVTSTQFRPPATIVFALGPLYLSGVLKSAPVEYELFDTDLTPLRARIDIELGIYEYVSLQPKKIPER